MFVQLGCAPSWQIAMCCSTILYVESLCQWRLGEKRLGVVLRDKNKDSIHISRGETTFTEEDIQDVIDWKA